MPEALAKSQNETETRVSLGLVLGGVVAVLVLWVGLIVWGLVWLAS